MAVNMIKLNDEIIGTDSQTHAGVERNVVHSIASSVRNGYWPDPFGSRVGYFMTPIFCTVHPTRTYFIQLFLPHLLAEDQVDLKLSRYEGTCWALLKLQITAEMVDSAAKFFS